MSKAVKKLYEELLESNSVPSSIPVAANSNDTLRNLFAGLANEGKINYRDEQVRLAEDIYNTFEKGKISIIESPTGTGKTLAYMAAAAEFCKKNHGRQVVIATTTKALQDQAIRNYREFLKELYPGLKIAILKGKSNYLDRVACEGLMSDLDTKEEKQALTRLLAEADKVNGDVELMDPSVVENFENTVSLPLENYMIDANEKDKASLYYVKKAAEAARAANIVVINHALFASYAFMNKAQKKQLDNIADTETASETLKHYARFTRQLDGIPIAFDNVVVDEAHQLEQMVKNMLTFSIPVPSVLLMMKRVLDGKNTKDISSYSRKKLNGLYNSINSLSSKLYEISSEYDTEYIQLKYYEKDEFTDDAVSLLENINSALLLLRKINTSRLGKKNKQYIGKYIEHCRKVLDIVKSKPDAKYKGLGFYARRWERREGVSILAVPAYASGPIRYMSSHFNSVVFISGTLSDTNGGFNSFKTDAGLKQLIETKGIYAERRYNGIDMHGKVKMTLYPNNPHPTDDGSDDNFKKVYEEKFVPANLDRVLKIVKNAKGGVMILCAAIWEAKIWVRLISQKIKNKNVYFYASSNKVPLSEILRKFEAEKAILISASTWTGVDTELSDLIIARMPYPAKNDPLIVAYIDYLIFKGVSRKKAEGTAMRKAQYSTFIKIRQGVGRLFRNEHSRGNIYILDHRATQYKDFFGKKFSLSLTLN